MRKNVPAILAISLALGTVATACGPEDTGPMRTVPEALRGVWVTDNRAYADRKMEILDEAVLFYTGGTVYEPYVVRSIEVEEQDDGTVYNIEHSGWESGSLMLSLKFRTADSTIVFTNQPTMVWRKVPSS